jgi:hypothetical protein
MGKAYRTGTLIAVTVLTVACVSAKNIPLDADVAADASADGSQPSKADGAAERSDVSDAAGSGGPDLRPADAPPPDARPPDTASAPPDLPPSPCPNGPAPPGYGLLCGCSGDGKIQCDGKCSKPDDTCIPTGEFYFLSSQFLGDARHLDTYDSPAAEAFMATMPGTSGQFWSIAALGGGTYRLTNMFLGQARSLEASADGSKLFMGTTGDVPAQKWRIRAAGVAQFRLTDSQHGDARSLDTRNDTVNDPFMETTGDFSGQLWKITKAP